MPTTTASASNVSRFKEKPSQCITAKVGTTESGKAIAGGQFTIVQSNKDTYIQTRNYIVRLNTDGTYLGSVDLSDIDWRHHRAEVGFILGRPAWGQGFAYEAMQAVMSYAATQGIKRLWARTHVGNNASEKLLTKHGSLARLLAPIIPFTADEAWVTDGERLFGQGSGRRC